MYIIFTSQMNILSSFVTLISRLLLKILSTFCNKGRKAKFTSMEEEKQSFANQTVSALPVVFGTSAEGVSQDVTPWTRYSVVVPPYIYGGDMLNILTENRVIEVRYA